MDAAYGFEFIIKDRDGETLIHREVVFNVPVRADRIDAALAVLFTHFFAEIFMKEEDDEGEKVN